MDGRIRSPIGAGRSSPSTSARRKDAPFASMRPDMRMSSLRASGPASWSGSGSDRTTLLARNPRLIYGRMTGWGQTGPLAQTAGHDINYIGLAGTLAAIGKPGEPATVPLNLVGDFGGGSMFLAMGILAALWERERSGKGTGRRCRHCGWREFVHDDVCGPLAGGPHIPREGQEFPRRCRSLLSMLPLRRWARAVGGRIGAEVLRRDDARSSASRNTPRFDIGPRTGRELHDLLERTFASRDQAHWIKLFEGSDACVAPVLSLEEAMEHPQLKARADLRRSMQGSGRRRRRRAFLARPALFAMRPTLPPCSRDGGARVVRIGSRDGNRRGP